MKYLQANINEQCYAQKLSQEDQYITSSVLENRGYIAWTFAKFESNLN